MTCLTCGQSLEWHQQNRPHHEFSSESGAMKVPEPTPEAPPTPIRNGGDAVLRMALLKAGVITEGQLKQAQLWVEKAAERGHALVVEPDPDWEGERQFRLLSFEELSDELGRKP